MKTKIEKLAEENFKLAAEAHKWIHEFSEASNRITQLEEGLKTIIEVEHGTRKELVSYCESLLNQEQ